MKFIVHYQAQDLRPSLSYLKQVLSQNLSAQPTDEVILNEITDELATQSFRPIEHEELHIALVNGQNGLQTAAKLKQLEYAPAVVWTGATLSQQEVEEAKVLPDIMLLPKWGLLNLDADSLAGETQLIMSESFYYGLPELAIEESLVHHQKVIAEKIQANKKVVSIHLAGDIEDAQGRLVSQFSMPEAQAWAKAISAQIIKAGLVGEDYEYHIVSSKQTGLYGPNATKLPINPHGPNGTGVDGVSFFFTTTFKKCLEAQQGVVKAIVAKHDQPDLNFATLHLAAQSGGCSFVPSGDLNLINYAQQQGGELCHYGKALSAISMSMHKAGLVSLLADDGTLMTPVEPCAKAIDLHTDSQRVVTSLMASTNECAQSQLTQRALFAELAEDEWTEYERARSERSPTPILPNAPRNSPVESTEQETGQDPSVQQWLTQRATQSPTTSSGNSAMFWTGAVVAAAATAALAAHFLKPSR